jgi:transcription antitermination factor NusG
MKRVDENPPERFPDERIDCCTGDWVVAKVKPRQEKATADDLIKRGIPYYLPMYTKVTRRRDNNKPRKSVLPLFPGYICICMQEPDMKQTVYEINRIARIITVRNQRRFVEQLQYIHTGRINDVPLSPAGEYICGEEVEVIAGPMKGIKGPIARIQDNTRVIISVEGLGKAAMRVDFRDIRRV